jgi:hypothetical protein
VPGGPSISIRAQEGIVEQIQRSKEGSRTLEDYPDDGEAHVAQTTSSSRRMIVRPIRLIGAQPELWPDWRYCPFLTNRTEDIATVESEDRPLAVVGLRIRDTQSPERFSTSRPTGYAPSGRSPERPRPGQDIRLRRRARPDQRCVKNARDRTPGRVAVSVRVAH